MGSRGSGGGTEGTDVDREVRDSLSGQVTFKLRAENDPDCVKNLMEQRSRQRRWKEQRFEGRKGFVCSR